jgi:transcriptional regulator with XRE-family HTH domain
MDMINPIRLKGLRRAKRWTQADLAERSKVDKQTISLIERGQRRDVRRNTIESLARALGVEAANLKSKTPIVEIEQEPRSAMTFRLDGAPRNALTLASMRYGVRAESIVELAPFLFTWAAEMSLRRRVEQVSALEQARSTLQELQSEVPHLDSQLTYWSAFDDIIAAEQKNIAARDIFAFTMEGDDFVPGVAADFKESEGPIVGFLRGLAEQIEPDAEFASWHPMDGPNYAICREEALKLVGADEDLANEIIAGNVSLHEMPPELLKANRLADRVAWAREKANEAAAARQALSEMTLADLDGYLEV